MTYPIACIDCGTQAKTTLWGGRCYWCGSHNLKFKGSVEMETPVFTKREPRPYDYQEMTWGKFLKLREWAKKTAQELGYPIYLVGSTLYKEIPRDFDVVMTIPEQEFEQRFGTMNESNFGEVLVKSFNAYVREYFDCVEAFECEESIKHHGYVPLDFKVYPDNWFTNEDKLLLGKPNNFTI